MRQEGFGKFIEANQEKYDTSWKRIRKSMTHLASIGKIDSVLVCIPVQEMATGKSADGKATTIFA